MTEFYFSFMKCAPSPCDIAYFCSLSLIIESDKVTCSRKKQRRAYFLCSEEQNWKQYWAALIPSTPFHSLDYILLIPLITLTRTIQKLIFKSDTWNSDIYHYFNLLFPIENHRLKKKKTYLSTTCDFDF